MAAHIVPDFPLIERIAAILIAFTYISLSSLIREPHRQRFNAIVVAGASGVYLSGGLGPWEFVFSTIMLLVAYKGLSNYTFIGLGWLLHTCWDILHHLYGNPIVPFDASSSAGCAVCDPILAIWFFAGAPDIFALLRRRLSPQNQ